MDHKLLVDSVMVLLTVSIFSTVGVLAFLGLRALPFNIDWSNQIAHFIFSVVSGVATYFFTDTFFGHGVEEASVTSIATAAVIGGITKLTG